MLMHEHARGVPSFIQSSITPTKQITNTLKISTILNACAFYSPRFERNLSNKRSLSETNCPWTAYMPSVSGQPRSLPMDVWHKTDRASRTNWITLYGLKKEINSKMIHRNRIFTKYNRITFYIVLGRLLKITNKS